MIRFCSLGSGSNGNAFYLQFGERRFLVDAGLSRKQLLLRLDRIGVQPAQIDGVFITHEHVDHVCGLEVLLKHHPIPVYINRDTFREIPFYIDPALLRWFEPGETLQMGNVAIQSLSKSHDAANPALYTFECGEISAGVITDAGFGCENIIAAVQRANVLFMETNYDEEMLRTGFYSPQLKRRVAGKKGHLSNTDAARIIARHASPNLQHLFLSHLSQNNNTPSLAIQTVKTILDQRPDLSSLNTILTSRQGVSPAVQIPMMEVPVNISPLHPENLAGK